MHEHRDPAPHAKDIRAALRWAQGELGVAKVGAARLTAEILLAHVLGWDRVRLLGHHDESPDPEAMSRFAALVRRRAAGEPLQYLTGIQEFFGLPYLVTPAVLIPRPETEILVEKALSISRGLTAEKLSFVDVGTGSGCIAVSFAHEERRAAGWAVDISLGALGVARENARRNNVLDRVGFVCGDLLDVFEPHRDFDFILSNPPYVAHRDAETLPVEVRDYEPRAALFSGESGMDAFARLIPQAAGRLANGGYMLLEVGAGMAETVSFLAAREGLSVESIEKDLQAIPRCVVARRCHG